MEAVIFIIVIVGIIAWSVMQSDDDSQDCESGAGASDMPAEPFALRIRRAEYQSWDCLVPEVRGVLSFPAASASYHIKLRMRDSTGDGPGFVVCEIPDLQHDDSTIFLYRGKSRKAPPPNHLAHISDWMTLSPIPIDALDFPRSGERSLVFRADVLYDSKKLGSIAKAETQVRLTVRRPGYVERLEMHQRWEDMSVALAVAVGIADGVLHARERNIIRDWINKRAAVHDDNEEEIRKRLIGRYNQSLSDPDDAEDIARELRDAPDSVKIMALELCFTVAGADDKTDAAEQEILNDIIETMEMEDIKRINSLRDRYLPPPEEHGDMEEFLGIRDDMTSEEKQKILRREFAKWNGLTASPDVKKREKAAFMLKLIAEVRDRIKQGDKRK